MFLRYALVLLALVLVACPDAGEDGTKIDLDAVLQASDAGKDGQVSLDTATPPPEDTSPVPDGIAPQEDSGSEDPCPGGFGCPCEEPGDCDDGYCVPASGGGSICTQPCVTDCPDGFTCKLLTGSTDAVYLCLPNIDGLCAACSSDSECGDFGGLCLQDANGDGRCGRLCSTTQPCPSQFTCETITSTEGESQQCVPTSGECPCSELLLGVLRVCDESNELGACQGTQMCTADGWTPCDATTPAAEICDDIDNDCDGDTDEDFPQLNEACDTEEDDDLCTNGQLACNDTGDGLYCADDTPAVEQCDGIDNNCDLVIDEGFPDTDNDGNANCVDDDDDGDADPDATDCSPEDDTIHAAAEELCDGIDNNCNNETDEGFPDADEDGEPDCLDPDTDGDGIHNETDNCPEVFNAAQEDLDKDEIGDVCDDDDDGDGVPDEDDLCPNIPDSEQDNFDGDETGDACDPDDDNDGSADAQDCNPFDADVFPNAVEICDGIDNNCNFLTDEGFPDLDSDLLANCIDPDDDNDLSPDEEDCAPLNPAIHPGVTEACNGIDDNCNEQIDEGFTDTNANGVADCLDNDDDDDGIPDAQDNCPTTPNPSQQNSDNDLPGDACDTDDDGDGSLDPDDCAPTNAAIHPGAEELCDGIDNNCNEEKDEGYPDTDGDGTADCLDTDDDDDGLPDNFDNCPTTPNPGQLNSDSDLLGNLCDTDDDNDGSLDGEDCEPTDSTIHPGADEVCDGKDNNCNDVKDEGFPDSDQNGIPDCLSDDDDGDGFPDTVDNCPTIPNPTQTNNDEDFFGDVCDDDDDNDGTQDDEDCAPTNPNIHLAAVEECDGIDNNCNDSVDEGYPNTDQDLEADCVDTDDDNDGIPDTFDNCPVDANNTQTNSDTDLQGDACDADDDNDGVPDSDDCAPTNPTIHPDVDETCDGIDNNCDNVIDEGFADTDQDGLADCLDPDDDGDGFPDVQDNCPKTKNPGQMNSDSDLFGDACDGDDDNDGTDDSLDCAPTNPDIHPNAPEICDGIDNNCNGETDENSVDTDNDGLADCIDNDDDADGIADLSDNCPTVGNTDQLNNDADLLGDACDDDDDNDLDPDITDCDPTDPTIHHNAAEVCDGIDNDCSGILDDDFPDFDVDGSADCVDEDDDNDTDPDETDCAPFNASIFSGAEEICGNDIDDDCDPTTTCFTVSQGDTVIPVEPFPGTKGVVSFYQYGNPASASSNTGLEISQQTLQFIYEDPTTDQLYIVIIHDRYADSGGGSGEVLISGGFGGDVVLMDDPGESGPTLNPDTGEGKLKWKWVSCCTDGAVIGPFEPPFCVTLDYNSLTGINGISTLDGNDVVPVGPVNEPTTLCANP